MPTINSKILLSGATAIAAAALVVGATFAYFSANASSNNNTFVAGTLTISVDQSMQTIDPVISNWAPGDTTTVRFDVVNTGSLPVNLRAFATGSWNGGGDATLVKVTQADYWNGSAWVTFASSASGLSGDIYYSPDGTNLNLFTVAGGGRAQIRLTVLFDSGADDSYQGKTYTAQITAEAKQTNAPSF